MFNFIGMFVIVKVSNICNLCGIFLGHWLLNIDELCYFDDIDSFCSNFFSYWVLEMTHKFKFIYTTVIYSMT